MKFAHLGELANPSWVVCIRLCDDSVITLAPCPDLPILQWVCLAPGLTGALCYGGSSSGVPCGFGPSSTRPPTVGLRSIRAALVAQKVKHLPAMQETWVQFWGWEDALEKGTASHSSILAWRIPWTEEPGGIKSMRSQRVGHN